MQKIYIIKDELTGYGYAKLSRGASSAGWGEAHPKEQGGFPPRSSQLIAVLDHKTGNKTIYSSISKAAKALGVPSIQYIFLVIHTPYKERYPG